MKPSLDKTYLIKKGGKGLKKMEYIKIPLLKTKWQFIPYF